MPRAQYADILRQRREQLGLTIPQAASVLRLRESVVEAFEAGDFAHLPPLGYAQGMVSSYARYLGLEPARLSELYEQEHASYIAYTTGAAPTGLASLSDEPGKRMPLSGAMRHANTGRVREDGVRAAADPGAGLDPVAASRARVGQAPLGASGYAERSNASRGSRAQANYGSMRPTNLPQRYNSSPGYGVEGSYSARQSSEDTSYASDRRYTSQMRYGQSPQDPNFEQGYERSGRRYTSRRPEQTDERARRSQAGRVRRSRATEDAYTERFERLPSNNQVPQQRNSIYADSYYEEIETRGVNAAYRDDLRYDSGASNYRASSTREGREGARNIQVPGRPENARRRSGNSAQGRGSSRSRNTQPRATGIQGMLQAFLADPKRAVLSIGVLLALILLLILVFSVRSCIEASSGTGKQVSVVTTLAATSEPAATTTSETEQAIIDAAASEKAASAEAAQYTETVVKVTVANGATTWLEITCDGEQKIAESVTGEWSQEYTVTQQIQIQVVDPSSVTVEKNGEIQTFSTKSAGLSSLTIQGTDPAAAAAATANTIDDAEDGSDDSDNSDTNTEE